MKKLIFSLLFLCSSIAFAEPYGAVRTGLGFVSVDFTDDYDPIHKYYEGDWEINYAVDMAVGYKLPHNFRVEGGVWLRMGTYNVIEDEQASYYAVYDRIDLVALMTGIFYDFDFGQTIVPFVGYFVGVDRVKIKEEYYVDGAMESSYTARGHDFAHGWTTGLSIHTSGGGSWDFAVQALDFGSFTKGGKHHDIDGVDLLIGYHHSF